MDVTEVNERSQKLAAKKSKKVAAKKASCKWIECIA